MSARVSSFNFLREERTRAGVDGVTGAMTVDALVPLLQAHFKSRGIVYADAETGERMYVLRESAIKDLAELIADVFPESWEERVTQEIPASTLELVRIASEEP